MKISNTSTSLTESSHLHIHKVRLRHKALVTLHRWSCLLFRLLMARYLMSILLLNKHLLKNKKWKNLFNKMSLQLASLVQMVDVDTTWLSMPRELSSKKAETMELQFSKLRQNKNPSLHKVVHLHMQHSISNNLKSIIIKNKATLKHTIKDTQLSFKRLNKALLTLFIMDPISLLHLNNCSLQIETQLWWPINLCNRMGITIMYRIMFKPLKET